MLYVFCGSYRVRYVEDPWVGITYTFRLLLSVLVTAGLLCAVAGCADASGDPIHYILPNGYRGPFKIVVDSAASGGYRYDGKCHIYTIPANGVLRVSSASPFKYFHRTSAEYVGGRQIACSEPGPAGPDAVRLTALGATESEFWMVVGTEADVQKCQQLWNRGELTQLESELGPHTR